MGRRVQEYQAHAAECERRAARASDPEVQAAYRAMIRCWLDLARRAEWLESREAMVVSTVIVVGAAIPAIA